MKCNFCNNEIGNNNSFCPYCGNAVSQYGRKKGSGGKFVIKILIVVLSLVCVAGIGFAAIKIIGLFQSKVSSVKLELQTEGNYENNDLCQYAIITGYNEDGTKEWTIETPKVNQVEPSAATEIGIYKKRYYYEANGTIYAVKLSNGEQIWEKAVGLAIVASDFDEKGTLYCCGWYPPYLLVVNKDGELVKRIAEFTDAPNYTMPYDIKYLNDHLEIKMEAPTDKEGIVVVNLPDYKYSFK